MLFARLPPPAFRLTRGQPGFQLRDPDFHLLQLFTGAAKHFLLNVEFLACHQIEAGKGHRQERSQILFDVLRRRGRDEFAEFFV